MLPYQEWPIHGQQFLPTFHMPCSSASVNFTFKSAFFASSMFHAVVVVLPMLPASRKGQLTRMIC